MAGRRGTATLVDGFRSLAADGSTVVRMLDLLRRLSRGRAQPCARPRRGWSIRPRLGIRVARGSPHPLQPRLGKTGRHAVERAQEARLVGRAGARDGPGSTRRTSRADKAPDYVPPPGATGDAALRGDAPFIMHDDGLGWIWVPDGLKDGPLPAHYEPLESPVRNRLYRQQVNPAADRSHDRTTPYARLTRRSLTTRTSSRPTG